MLSFDRRSFQAKTRSSINRATITVLGSQISKNAKKQKGVEKLRQSSRSVTLIHFFKFISARISIMTVLSWWLRLVELH